MHQNMHQEIPRFSSYEDFLYKSFIIVGAGRGGRTPTRLPSADFESAASASSAIPAYPSTTQNALN